MLDAADRRTLEELYLPFKPRRKTRASAARELGLEPLAAILLAQRHPGPPADAVLAPFVDPARGVPTAEAALAGACDIVAEEWSLRADVRAFARAELERAMLASRKKRGYAGSDDRFEAFYAYREPVSRVASHRFLALRRGAAEGVLSIGLEVDQERTIARLRERLLGDPRFAFHRALRDTALDAWKRLLAPSLESEVLEAACARAETEAIAVFARNLRELLLAPPAGSHAASRFLRTRARLSSPARFRHRRPSAWAEVWGLCSATPCGADGPWSSVISSASPVVN